MTCSSSCKDRACPLWWVHGDYDDPDLRYAYEDDGNPAALVTVAATGRRPDGQSWFTRMPVTQEMMEARDDQMGAYVNKRLLYAGGTA